MMNKDFAIISSEADQASKLILKQLNKLGFPAWATLYTFKEDIIHADLNRVAERDVIFLSRHKSEAGTKSLTVHSLGNFGSSAEVGGKPKSLCGTLPLIEANYLRALAKKNESTGLVNDGFVVSLEVTHHGPFHPSKNCVFIELGSSEREWGNELAAKIIAEVVLEETFRGSKSAEPSGEAGRKDKIVIGFGGGHYCPDFTKLVLRQNYAFGHICPKYALENLDENTFQQMIDKTRPGEIILDWKGLKEWKDKVMGLCEKSGLPVQRVQNLLGY